MSQVSFSLLKSIYGGEYPLRLSTYTSLQGVPRSLKIASYIQHPSLVLNFDASSIRSVAVGSQITKWENFGTLGSAYDATAFGTGSTPRLTTGSDGRLQITFNYSANQYFRIVNSLPITWLNNNGVYNGFTIFIVAKPVSGFNRFIDFGNGTANNNIWGGNISGGNFRGVIWNSTTTNLTGWTGGAYTDTPTYHVYILNATNSATGMTLSSYVDNTTTPVGTATNAAPIANRTSTLNYIGKSNWTSDPLYNGDMRQVMMFNKSLSSAEMASIYQALKAKWGL